MGPTTAIDVVDELVRAAQVRAAIADDDVASPQLLEETLAPVAKQHDRDERAALQVEAGRLGYELLNWSHEQADRA